MIFVNRFKYFFKNLFLDASSEGKDPETHKQDRNNPRKLKSNLQKPNPIITWIKKSKLLEERPQLFDYKESRTSSIRMNTSKKINLW